MQVEVVGRPAIPSETELPRELIDALDSHELRASWQQNSQQFLSTYHGMGMRPITRPFLEDLAVPSDIFFYSPEGFVQKQDCVLMVEPKALHAQRLAVEEEIRRRREGAGPTVEALNEEIARVMRDTGVNLAASSKASGVPAGLFGPSIQVKDARDYLKTGKPAG